eukprot:scaffold938_cov334-Pavlova_lutheri.AAC.18
MAAEDREGLVPTSECRGYERCSKDFLVGRWYAMGTYARPRVRPRVLRLGSLPAQEGLSASHVHLACRNGRVSASRAQPPGFFDQHPTKIRLGSTCRVEDLPSPGGGSAPPHEPRGNPETTVAVHPVLIWEIPLLGSGFLPFQPQLGRGWPREVLS